MNEGAAVFDICGGVLSGKLDRAVTICPADGKPSPALGDLKFIHAARVGRLPNLTGGGLF